MQQKSDPVKRDIPWCRANCPLGSVSGTAFVPDAVLDDPSGPGIVLAFSHPIHSEISGRRWWESLVPAGVKVLAVVYDIRCPSGHWQAHYSTAKEICARRYRDPRTPRPDYVYCTLEPGKALVSDVFRDLLRSDIARAYRLAHRTKSVVLVAFGPQVYEQTAPWTKGMSHKQARGSWWRAVWPV